MGTRTENVGRLPSANPNKRGQIMNKNAIKSFAIDARKWLREKIEIKLGELGITAEGVSGVYQQTETEVKVTDLSAPINRVQYENLKKYMHSLPKVHCTSYLHRIF
jgi:hypothetical protein